MFADGGEIVRVACKFGRGNLLHLLVGADVVGCFLHLPVELDGGVCPALSEHPEEEVLDVETVVRVRFDAVQVKVSAEDDRPRSGLG